MLVAQAWARIGGLGVRLLEQPRQRPDERLTRFWFVASHRDAPGVTAICFLGYDREHAGRQFDRRIDNELARRAAE